VKFKPGALSSSSGGGGGGSSSSSSMHIFQLFLINHWCVCL
jgi:hypothetical protein